MSDKIESLTEKLKNVNVEFIVLKLLSLTISKDKTKVYTYLVADETASIELVLFDTSLKIGDVVSIVDGTTFLYKNNLHRLGTTKNSVIRRISKFRKNFNVSEHHKCIKIVEDC